MQSMEGWHTARPPRLRKRSHMAYQAESCRVAWGLPSFVGHHVLMHFRCGPLLL